MTCCCSPQTSTARASIEKMTEQDQQALQKGFQGLGDNIDRLYARPLQKVGVTRTASKPGHPRLLRICVHTRRHLFHKTRTDPRHNVPLEEFECHTMACLRPVSSGQKERRERERASRARSTARSSRTSHLWYNLLCGTATTAAASVYSTYNTASRG